MLAAAEANAYLEALKIPEAQRVLTIADVPALLKEPGPQHLVGVNGCGSALVVAECVRAGRQVVLVSRESDIAQKCLEDLAFLAPTLRAVSLSSDQQDPYAQTQPERRTVLAKMSALSALERGHWDVLCCDAVSLTRKLPPRSVVSRATLELHVDQDIDVDALSQNLTNAGYLRVPVVEDPGTFAVRGGLVDVWSPAEAAPVRAELFGDMILGLKCFEPESQRTLDEVQSVVLPPAREAVLTEQTSKRAQGLLRELCDECNYPSVKTRQLIEEVCSGRHAFGQAALLPAFYELVSLWEYVSKDALVILEEPVDVLKQLNATQDAAQAGEERVKGQPSFTASELALPLEELAPILEQRAPLCLSNSAILNKSPADFFERLESPSEDPQTLAQSDHQDLLRAVKAARASKGKRAALDPLVERLSAWHEHGLVVTAVARTHTQATRLASLLRHRDIELTLHEEAGAWETSSASLNIVSGPLERGVIAPAERRVLITEEEVFGHRKHTRTQRSKRRGRDALQDLRALAPGDLVVHVEHGVGKYVGLENRPGPGNTHLELLVVEYLGGKLFLPVYRLNQIQKFSGDKPKLDRLGGQSFARTKAKARKKAREMADELLRLYAERNNAKKTPLPPPDDDYAAFEAAFPYEETPDQAGAIVDVGEDLEKPQVMDRLVCGDVGFGKTEVALRAAFRVASAGMQVALLCPTTVLAQQHYLTFARRLEDHPIEVRVLSRFQSKKEVTQTLEGLKKGTVDIVVGTHRLLSKDLQFKHLGLLVIDEEQRFGVTHKERIKQLRTSVDVLTLTATPIPRTLQQAVGGLREMSLISTPPVDRRAIRTIVSRFDEAVIKEAIEREMSRGGQVFYVYNRVEGLYERAQRLQQLIPSARVAVGHGQMKESTLERTMLDFMEGEYDVLVATSIIESGLDIPRANTMIVDRADLFGLAQLYQLRGRVGRSPERAYCYLLVPAPSELSDDARSRIDALERYTELGSGFQIATLDMEIRGAGDLLGADQSGPVSSVGLELFCQMLEEATAELRGDEVVHDIEPDLNFDVEALLPEGYISEVGIRLSFYKRLASARDEAEVAYLGTEMEDRFGPPPESAKRLVELMRLKTELRRLKVVVCEGTKSGVSIRLREDTPLEPAALVELVSTQKAKYRLSPDGKLTRRVREKEAGLGSLALADQMMGELCQLL